VTLVLLPGTTELGVIDETVGEFGGDIVTANEVVPPPGDGFVSASVAAPASDKSVAEIPTDN
jgi:hypothetical protein